MKDPGKRWKTLRYRLEKTFSNCISKKRLVSKYIKNPKNSKHNKNKNKENTPKTQ